MKTKHKTKTKYVPMPGSRLSAKHAEMVGHELGRIAEKHGCAKANVVVEASRPEQAPLHSFFTWDNDVAAEKWREDEARTLIRSVRIVSDEMPCAEQPVIRAFVSVQASDCEQAFEGHGYIPVTKAKDSPDYSQQVVNSAMQELKEWQRRYSDYSSYFNDVFAAIDAVPLPAMSE